MRMCPGLVALMLGFVAGLAGCIDAPAAGDDEGNPSGVERPADAYWFVWITGRQSREPRPGSVCDVAWAHSVDPAAKTIEYAANTYTQNHVDAQPGTVIASEVWGPGDCPVSYKATSTGRIEIDSEALGRVVVLALADGRIQAGDTIIHPGQSLTLRDEDSKVDRYDGAVTYSAEILIRAMGPWPHAGLTAKS